MVARNNKLYQHTSNESAKHKFMVYCTYLLTVAKTVQSYFHSCNALNDA